LGHTEGQVIQGASLTEFLLFWKKLSSEPFAFGRLNPKTNRSLRTQTAASDEEVCGATLTNPYEKISKRKSSKTIDAALQHSYLKGGPRPVTGDGVAGSKSR
jgi:hypothetical protein